MTTSHTSQNNNPAMAPDDVFSDPVAYLAAFGIESELIVEAPLPAAA